MAKDVATTKDDNLVIPEYCAKAQRNIAVLTAITKIIHGDVKQLKELLLEDGLVGRVMVLEDRGKPKRWDVIVSSAVGALVGALITLLGT